MKNIFFIGNSFTYYNNLPFMVQLLATEAGIRTNCDSQTRGGAYLHEFAEHQQGEHAIKHCEGNMLRSAYANQFRPLGWNTVVLQDQSCNPACDREDFFKSVETLLQDVFTHGEELFFYQTWAYHPDSQRYTDKEHGVEVDYETLYCQLREAYAEAADRFHGTLIPVGDGFYRVFRDYPEINLYHEDKTHPSPMGTYLAACICMAKLFDIDPRTLVSFDGLDEKQATILRSVAAELTGKK